MMGTILVETDKQGQRICQDWKLTTENELRAYVGLCILRGVYRSKNQAVRQLWSPEFGPPIFSKTMSMKRFEDIRLALRFDDPTTRNSRLARDKLAAVRLLYCIALSRSYREKRSSATSSCFSQNQKAISSQSRKRSRCELCPRADDKKTSTKCGQCKQFICPNHMVISCNMCANEVS
ncbi:uncharacterized protein LOC143041722 isoform X1 [Oratosquilla oratoria]|uniref:uncharacterized protein LOC143041722 isoform X1 n=1 Tax=Oratosquilla oratoria TaxID=337810 RepID=UPI003F7751A4